MKFKLYEIQDINQAQEAGYKICDKCHGYNKYCDKCYGTGFVCPVCNNTGLAEKDGQTELCECGIYYDYIALKERLDLKNLPVRLSKVRDEVVPPVFWKLSDVFRRLAVGKTPNSADKERKTQAEQAFEIQDFIKLRTFILQYAPEYLALWRAWLYKRRDDAFVLNPVVWVTLKDLYDDGAISLKIKRAIDLSHSLYGKYRIRPVFVTGWIPTSIFKERFGDTPYKRLNYAISRTSPIPWIFTSVNINYHYKSTGQCTNEETLTCWSITLAKELKHLSPRIIKLTEHE